MRLPDNSMLKVEKENGFTIIEFMIASAVFSSVLLIVAASIIYFYKTYYKSEILSLTQTTVQNISDIVEQSVKLSSSTPEYIAPLGSSPARFCAGSTEFAYYTGRTEGTSEIPTGYALYEQSVPDGSCPSATWTNGTSLLGANFRLINFNVSQVGSTSEWTTDIKIAYNGEKANNGDDLLCDPVNVAGSCVSSAVLSNFTSSDIQCKSTAGSQFCDVSELQSIVERRLP